MESFEEKTLRTESIFNGKVVSLQVDEVELPNGKTSKREIIKHPGAVAVIALTEDKKIIMVEQFRKALEKHIIEIPAGKLERGEKPEVCAQRELEEETGYVCSSMEWLMSFYTSPGFADELIHLYLAKGLTLKENPAAADEDEFVRLMEVTIEEAKGLMAQQRIHDAKTVLALQYLQLHEELV
ncbi:NUDIX hydrolase [Bacillus massilinigeriensis]|uniref:NUDIX hydrolase n=1 Tax=Bacillus mediterraneensis TaxID=1805474 RepID=UPI0008F84264|nr:NUDIX hydrolase [Bacillus mediterraneensis]